jgi:uncharacterized protein (DUF924 family)
MTAPEELLRFWLDEVGPAKWYIHDPALDSAICEEFMGVWEQAMQGKFSLWLTYPSGALAYCILLDQFSRNMFRGQAKAFSADRGALAAAKSAIHYKWDLRIDEPARQFFYLPLMHSENLPDQDRCVRLIKTRLQDTDGSSLEHAKAHREVIRMFGRFPFRNDALSRPYTDPERIFSENGGYEKALNQLEAAV